MSAPVVHFEKPGVTLWHGDCIETMRLLPDASVDAVVTDPPYGLEFMGKDWDSFGRDTSNGYREKPRITTRSTDDEGAVSGFAGPKGGGVNSFQAGRPFQTWCTEWATEALRVLKPGGHLLAFGGSRTWHRLAAGIEDAGFEIRDSIAWLYGSGFPKSMDVSKAIDKLDAVAERLARAREFQSWLRQHLTPQRVNELTRSQMGHLLTTHPTQPAVATAAMFDLLRPELPDVPDRIEQLVHERTVESENFAAREVLGTKRAGIATPGDIGRHTVGGSRAVDVAVTRAATAEATQWEGWGTALKPAFEPIVVGRKPLAGTVAANVLAHGTGALNIDASRIEGVRDRTSYGLTGAARSAGTVYGEPNATADFDSSKGRWPANVLVDGSQARAIDAQTGGASHSDELAATGASRFLPTFRYEAKAATAERPNVDGVQHPTVKPRALMEWLVRLVTPPGGTVLEPFAGSGTTLEAAVREGFTVIGIEREADYLPLIVHRLAERDHQQSLFGDWDEAS